MDHILGQHQHFLLNKSIFDAFIITWNTNEENERPWAASKNESFSFCRIFSSNFTVFHRTEVAFPKHTPEVCGRFFFKNQEWKYGFWCCLFTTIGCSTKCFFSVVFLFKHALNMSLTIILHLVAFQHWLFKGAVCRIDSGWTRYCSPNSKYWRCFFPPPQTWRNGRLPD